MPQATAASSPAYRAFLMNSYCSASITSRVLLQDAVGDCAVGYHLHRTLVCSFQYLRCKFLRAMIMQLSVKAGNCIHIDGYCTYIVGDKHYRHSLLQLLQKLIELRLHGGVDACGRLIEKQQSGLSHQRPRYE